MEDKGVHRDTDASLEGTRNNLMREGPFKASCDPEGLYLIYYQFIKYKIYSIIICHTVEVTGVEVIGAIIAEIVGC